MTRTACTSTISSRTARRAAVAGISLLAALGACSSPASAATTSGAYDHLLAPEASCPGQSSSTATVAAQTSTMHCLLDFARAWQGLRPTPPLAALDTSAASKAADILRCQQFSHTACGRTWDYFISRSGVRFSRWAENIAWGSDNGSYSTPRSIMRSWLYSDGHRANILNANYNASGVGLVRGTFSGYRAGVWVQHFGTR